MLGFYLNVNHVRVLRKYYARSAWSIKAKKGRGSCLFRIRQFIGLYSIYSSYMNVFHKRHANAHDKSTLCKTMLFCSMLLRLKRNAKKETDVYSHNKLFRHRRLLI